MLVEKFIRGYNGIVPVDAKELFLKIVKRFDVNRVIQVIGKRFHIIKKNPLNYKNRKACYQPAGNATGKIECIKQNNQDELVSMKTNQYP